MIFSMSTPHALTNAWGVHEKYFLVISRCHAPNNAWYGDRYKASNLLITMINSYFCLVTFENQNYLFQYIPAHFVVWLPLQDQDMF